MNQTSVKEFIFLGISNDPRVQVLLFTSFVFIYFGTILGNIIIILVITVDPLLHSPMYRFLRNLSMLEACYITVTIPKMLITILSRRKNINLISCGVQMYMFVFIGTADCFLLAAMAYDRYVAICHPLHYTTIITKRVCARLTTGAWLIGGTYSLGQTSATFSLSYCGPNIINHFFCDVLPLLKLACSDTQRNKVATYIAGVLIVFMPFVLIVTSYVYIIAAILKIRSAMGRHKAFSTCASHLLSVSLFYGTGTCAYVLPKSGHWQNSDKLLALFYAAVLPMLNPLIYSLRNQEVKGAVRKVLSRTKCSGQYMS
ncbi:olfactory receptor 10A7-like [Pleurodeles waltl]|uniref:olfactory receptor 10A7-like n=1 Tax=Pleurodeles waltl TaxID=8319 RepID=UPI003709912B